MIFEENGFYFHLADGKYLTYCWTGIDDKYTPVVIGKSEAEARETIRASDDGHFGGGLVACNDRTEMEAFEAKFGEQRTRSPEAQGHEPHSLVSNAGRDSIESSTDWDTLATAFREFVSTVEPIVNSINGPDRIPCEDATRAERELVLIHRRFKQVLIAAKVARMPIENSNLVGIYQNDDRFDNGALFIVGEGTVVRNAIITFLGTVGKIVDAIRQDSYENCSGEEDRLSEVCARLSDIIRAIDEGKTRCWPFAEPGHNERVKAAVQALQPHLERCDALKSGLRTDTILADIAAAEMQHGYKYVVWDVDRKAESGKQTVLLVCNVEAGRLERIEYAAGPIVDDATFKTVIDQLANYTRFPSRISRFDPDVAACIQSALPERKIAPPGGGWSEPPF